MWFVLSLACVFFWGAADLFYKKGTNKDDRLSHLKIAVWVGFVMGAVSVLLSFTNGSGGVHKLLVNAVKYSPASLSYIVSMVIGYAGLRYLEVSIISPVQNASGALSAIVMFIWFSLKGKINSMGEEFSYLDLLGTVIIAAGVIALAVIENALSKSEKKSGVPEKERKYRYGALALIFPVAYCIFDTVGTAADGIILDGQSDLDITEIDALVLYGFTFFLAGVGAYVYIAATEKKAYNPFSASELPKGIAATLEEGGQIFYIFAMAAKPLLAAPMIASYCIVSVILSRIFIKEKLQSKQFVCVILVIVGIVMLGISEGLGEAGIDFNRSANKFFATLKDILTLK